MENAREQKLPNDTRPPPRNNRYSPLSMLVLYRGCLLSGGCWGGNYGGEESGQSWDLGPRI